MHNTSIPVLWSSSTGDPTSLSSVAIFQSMDSRSIHFTRHNSYVTLDLQNLWKCSDFLDRTQLNLPNKSYVAPKLKSWLRKFYSRHHDLIDRYEISISQMTMNLLIFMLIFVFFHLLLLRLLADLTLSLYDDFIVNIYIQYSQKITNLTILEQY